MLAGVLVLAGCDSPGSETVGAVTGSAPPRGAEPVTTSSGAAELIPSPPAGEADDLPDGADDLLDGADDPTRTLPNLVGKGLQSAQDRAQDAGFRRLGSHDALGRERVQVFDREWRVCFQSPAPGRQAVDSEVELGAVKLAEACPAKDRGEARIAEAGATMPNLRGISARAALSALGHGASVSWRDGTGKGRSVLLPTNWKICAQSPRSGAGYDGVPVTLTVVKYDEKC